MDPYTAIDDPGLGLPRPFVRALLNANITTLGEAWARSDEDLLTLHGVGQKGVRKLRALEA
jgi:hypothetical protein